MELLPEDCLHVTGIPDYAVQHWWGKSLLEGVSAAGRQAACSMSS